MSAGAVSALGASGVELDGAHRLAGLGLLVTGLLRYQLRLPAGRAVR